MQVGAGGMEGHKRGSGALDIARGVQTDRLDTRRRGCKSECK